MRSSQPLLSIQVIAKPPGRRDSDMQQLQVWGVRWHARIEETVFVSIDVHFEQFDHVSVVKLQKGARSPCVLHRVLSKVRRSIVCKPLEPVKSEAR